MGRRKVARGASRGSEGFGRWLAKTAYSIDQVALALRLKPVSIYALRNGYWRPSLEVALLIQTLTVDAVPVRYWTEPPRQPRKRRRKVLTKVCEPE